MLRPSRKKLAGQHQVSASLHENCSDIYQAYYFLRENEVNILMHVWCKLTHLHASVPVRNKMTVGEPYHALAGFSKSSPLLHHSSLGLIFCFFAFVFHPLPLQVFKAQPEFSRSVLFLFLLTWLILLLFSLKRRRRKVSDFKKSISEHVVFML